MNDIQARIEQFKMRVKEDPEFCLELFDHATVRLMASKYAYYVESNPYQDDVAYDLEEKGWYVMGIGLGLLKEDETSPCVDWDDNHPKAAQGIKLYEHLRK